MMRDWRKKPPSKQNINPVSFPLIPPSMLRRVDCFLNRAQKQAETIPIGEGPIGEGPKTTRDKRTNGKGGRSGKGNEHGIQKYEIKILRKVRGSQVVKG